VECTAKAQAKADCEEAKKQSIIHAAEFEHADRADEDTVDATPHPPFTPKPWPPLHNQKKANLIPVAEISNVEMSDDVKMSDDVDKASFVLPCSRKSISDDDSAVESDGPPPIKKSKAQMARKVAGEAGKRKKDDNGGVVPASAEGQPQEPKPKKVKVKVCNEINIMAKKIEDKTQGAQNKYGNMVKSMSSTRAEAQPSGKPASKTPLQVQVTGGRRLKREGVIADIKALYDQDTTPTNPNLSTNHLNLMEINNRYILLTYTFNAFIANA